MKTNKPKRNIKFPIMMTRAKCGLCGSELIAVNAYETPEGGLYVDSYCVGDCVRLNDGITDAMRTIITEEYAYSLSDNMLFEVIDKHREGWRDMRVSEDTKN